MLLRGSGLRALLVCTREAASLRARAQTNTFAFMDSNRKAAAVGVHWFCRVPWVLLSAAVSQVPVGSGERLSVPNMCWHMWCWGGAMTPHTLGNTLLLNCTPGQILTSLAFIP